MTTATRDLAASPAHKLDDVARTLRAAVDRTARSLVLETKPSIAAPPASHARTTPLDVPAPTESELPQILQSSRGLAISEPPSSGPERRRGQMLAPTILGSALAAVAMLMSASITDLSGLPGLGWTADKPRPRLSPISVQPLLNSNALASLDANTAESAALQAPSTPVGEEDLALLERCEAMIARGDMQGAREELARAANTGSPGARFALAETFDPNVLAAWGLRQRVADVGAARALYAQALAAGDQRAQSRLVALEGERP